jgi:hypothetical protein
MESTYYGKSEYGRWIIREDITAENEDDKPMNG